MYIMYMIITDLFDIDIHIFTVIKFLFNLVVKFKYIYEELVKVEARREEKWKENVDTDQKEKREGTA